MMYRGNNNRQRMINLMYIVFIAMMGLEIHQDKQYGSSKVKTQQIRLNSQEKATPSSPIQPNSPNKYVARVIAPSQNIIQGTYYEADLALTLQHPHGKTKIIVDGEEIQGQGALYRKKALKVGAQQYFGHIELTDKAGNNKIYPFEGSYQVVKPQISLVSQRTNILYAGIDNELSVIVPGIFEGSLHLSGDKVSIKRQGKHWLVKPLISQGTIKFDLSMRQKDGDMLYLGKYELPIRPLPPPTPYIQIQDGTTSEQFRGGSLSRRQLLGSATLKASVDDGLLYVASEIESFQLITFDALGNAIPELSSGNQFSDRQKRLIQNSSQGKRLYITEIVARGVDGIKHRLPAIEIILR